MLLHKIVETTTKLINYIHQNENRKEIFQKDLEQEIYKGTFSIVQRNIVNKEMENRYEQVRREKELDYLKIK